MHKERSEKKERFLAQTLVPRKLTNIVREEVSLKVEQDHKLENLFP